MPRTGIIGLLFSTLSLSATASDLLALAHNAGFNRCDSAIQTEFSDMARVGNAVASTGYFNDRSFNVMATWGKDQDSVWKNTTFIKFGRSCLAYSVINTTFAKGCDTFKQQNPEWEEIRKQGDFIWTRNAGGVNAILKSLPNGVCSVNYRIHQTYDSENPSVASKRSEATKTNGG
ncbi:hypothetical protein GZ77_06485 [Endozoicomonas montiporae]|uniref:Uncharacterized protein n=2 Tax=Endozoicomonas montiporae TaxID=1027273 RepID=A0A081NCC7_9GAMM|nr:hypothetical protein [Endozoicomonas montiporae]AMO56433.1 hypothetical protein EZMO1_2336 [Endozoicomonas montiporae CL-33]KEQ16100.1 hypothetical protein GZ77_06485 [Endozoicomonas montiporae]